MREDNANKMKVSEVNNELKRYCEQNNLSFLINNNIKANGLNGSKLHFNKKGTSLFASNNINHLNSDF